MCRRAVTSVADPSPVNLVVASPKSTHRRIGEILVAQGIISTDQLDEVLRLQNGQRGTRLGRLLTDLGYVTDDVLAEAVADQMRLPTIDVATIQVPADVVARVPRELALRTRCLPCHLAGRDLLVATSDPTDVHALDQIAFKTGLRVKPAVAPEGDLGVALDRHYTPDDVAPLVSTDTITVADHLEMLDEIEESAIGQEDDLVRAAHTAPVVRLVNAIFVDAVQAGASDIHIEPQQKGVNLRYRVDGVLRHVLTMPKRSQAKVVSRVKIISHMDIAERRKPQDGRTRVVLGGSNYDLRVSTLPTADGETVVVRILAQDRAKVALDELGFAPDVLTLFTGLLRRPQGLLLVTGPTGSGKTSTLYAGLNFVVDETINVVTVEDPIEYRLPGISQVAVSEKSGLSFAVGLRAILRQDPDVVMVGEIRDLETAHVAFQAAQTGHLVLATLHTNDAPSAVTRLVDMGVPSYLVASSVIGVLAQRLTRRACSCAIRQADGTVLPNGCPACRQSGYRGRVALHELLVMSPAIRRAVLNEADVDLVRDTACRQGMRTLFEDGMVKVAAAITTADELRRVVPPPDEEGQAA